MPEDHQGPYWVSMDGTADTGLRDHWVKLLCVGLQILPFATPGWKEVKKLGLKPVKVSGTPQLPLCWSVKSIPVGCPGEKQVVRNGRTTPLMSAEEKEGFLVEQEKFVLQIMEPCRVAVQS